MELSGDDTVPYRLKIGLLITTPGVCPISSETNSSPLRSAPCLLPTTSLLPPIGGEGMHILHCPCTVPVPLFAALLPSCPIPPPPSHHLPSKLVYLPSHLCLITLLPQSHPPLHHLCSRLGICLEHLLDLLRYGSCTSAAVKIPVTPSIPHPPANKASPPSQGIEKLSSFPCLPPQLLQLHVDGIADGTSLG